MAQPQATTRGAWFPEARYGLFIHWGPYAQYGRGEQVLFRERLDQREYAARACAWNPADFDARAWARTAKRAGFRYAVLTARHHDGFCLWDSKVTDYTSAAQAPKRDFVREYADAFRAEGLKVGLYYSLADWCVPAYYLGPRRDPAGWTRFRDYVHAQVEELLTGYGPLATFWFDGAWPRNARAWESERLVARMRQLQPDMLVNNRLDANDPEEGPGLGADGKSVEAAGESRLLGDFGTPEHHITAEKGRLWESCQVTTWRLWGYAAGERWRPADLWLDMLTEATAKGGNLLLNVGPDGDGRLPAPFVERAEQVGEWLRVHGECVYGPNAADGAGPGANDVTEAVTYGRQIVKGNSLYLLFRFWPGEPTFRLAGLETRIRSATLLTTGRTLGVVQSADEVTLSGLPPERPTPLFPVVRLDCDGPPAPRPWARERLWSGDPLVMAEWAGTRGTSVRADGYQEGEPAR